MVGWLLHFFGSFDMEWPLNEIRKSVSENIKNFFVDLDL